MTDKHRVCGDEALGKMMKKMIKMLFTRAGGILYTLAWRIQVRFCIEANLEKVFKMSHFNGKNPLE